MRRIPFPASYTKRGAASDNSVASKCLMSCSLADHQQFASAASRIDGIEHTCVVVGWRNVFDEFSTHILRNESVFDICASKQLSI